MTNTLNTPVEALEAAYPVRVTRYGLRPGSGGRGHHRGGDGVVREIEFLAPAQVTLLTERRRIPPYGLQGGRTGHTGRNVHIARGSTRVLGGKAQLTVLAGDRIRVLTAGGGGWGRGRGRRRPRRGGGAGEGGAAGSVVRQRERVHRVIRGDVRARARAFAADPPLPVTQHPAGWSTA
jgi:N-methylhydantoinase B/oxoprolinase/acetone carboxylase alpha subunit